MRELTTTDIKELYYMTDEENLRSILDKGILSHTRAEKVVNHHDVSNSSVQGLRADKYLERAVASKKALTVHQHAVLYINPHNAMMRVIKDSFPKLCVLRISKTLLERRGAIISSRNAATTEASFFTPDAFRLSPTSSAILTNPKAFGKGTDSEKLKRKQVRQAEILIPYEINPRYIVGIIVRSAEHRATIIALLGSLGMNLPIEVAPSLFFEGPGAPFTSLAIFAPINSATIEHPESPASSVDDEEMPPTQETIDSDSESTSFHMSPPAKPAPIKLFRPVAVAAPSDDAASMPAAAGAGFSKGS